ncbi:NAD(P)/FAD-dependent oxidoreductase [Parasediminibacterium sp. JCM 36343]|uniref:NAD(P)/FAD-dependent oxidoreductase n=1 Tax=Parasediminibacterium sp. JCM 36343 TaxID=3374279 RepID=UPI00397A0507
MAKTLIVIGGGAAGFFCAVNAARMDSNLRVLLLEKQQKLLSKVKVSGGGRCNVTHACFDIAELIQFYPRGKQFLKKAFHWFNTNHTVSWFEERGVTLKTEADGRMFPSTDNSQTIVDCLLKEATKYKVEVYTGCDVSSIAQKEEKWQVKAGAAIYNADFICIAAGGYATAEKFAWLQQLGHTIETPVPSLFTFNMLKNPIKELMGVSVANAQIKLIGSKLQTSGPLLITHWGLSGPAVLKLSGWGARELADKQYQFSILVNWLQDTNEQQLRENWQYLRNEHATQKIGGKNPFGLPSRLWLYFLALCGIKEDTRWAELPSAAQNKLIATLTAQQFDVSGKTTFKEEFVTCGGIKLNEIDPNTMQSKKINNLFFAGEVMDIDGVTGGFNFQNAWTSGWIAAKAIAS